MKSIDCKHERASIKCPDCGIDFVGKMTMPSVEPSGLAAQIEDARKRIEAWPDDVRVAMGLPPKPGPVCGRPTEGHSIGTCTKPYGHKNHCWFPNMWNDM